MEWHQGSCWTGGELLTMSEPNALASLLASLFPSREATHAGPEKGSIRECWRALSLPGPTASARDTLRKGRDNRETFPRCSESAHSGFRAVFWLLPHGCSAAARTRD